MGITSILEGDPKLKVPPEKMRTMYEAKLKALNVRSQKYWDFLSLLHDLSAIFERNRFTFASLERFSARDDVRDIVAKLRSLEEQIQVERRSEEED